MKRVAVALVDSLLTAMVRANGDALVMHVGEKPIVVARSRSIDLSSRGLNLNAMVGMLAQLLPADAQASLVEFGAVEHQLPPRGSDHFTVVAARGGDDIWIEIRRRREDAPEDGPMERPSTQAAAARGPAGGERSVLAAADEPPEISAAVAEGMPDAAVTASGLEHSPARVEVKPESTASPAVADVRPAVRAVRDVALELEDRPEVPIVPGLPESFRGNRPVVDGQPAVDVPADMEAAPVVAAPTPTGEREPEVVSEAAGELEGGPPQEPESSTPSESIEPARSFGTPTYQAPGEPRAVTEPQVEDAPVHEGEPVAPRETEAPAVEQSAAGTVLQSEEQPAAAPPMVEQEEMPVIPDAEIPRPMTEDLAAPSLTPQTAMVDVHSFGAVTAAGGPRAAAGMTPPAASHPSADVPPPAAPPHTAPPPSAEMGVPHPVASQPPSGLAPEAAAVPSAAPVTRTVRIEVPSRAAAPRAVSADRLLRVASDRGATELFLMTQARPYVRVAGEVGVLTDEPVLSATELDAVLADITPEPSRDAVSRGERVEWLVELADVGRVRCASFRDHRGPGAVFHLLATRAASAEQLGLEADARSLASEPDGLVIVAGPAGSDKSAILAAFVDEINRHRADYMITIEPCVYLVHENVQALVSQREVGTEAGRAAAATRAALNENPDVLVIDDLASGDVAALAVQAASQGRLVLVSLEAGSSAEAVQRLIELVPAEKRSATREALARTFRGAIAQQLLRKTAGGRVAARELLMGTGAIARVLGDHRRPDVAAAIDATRGGATLADAVAGYVKSGVVDVREAFRKAPDRERLVTALRAAGVSTDAIDRLQ